MKNQINLWHKSMVSLIMCLVACSALTACGASTVVLTAGTPTPEAPVNNTGNPVVDLPTVTPLTIAGGAKTTLPTIISTQQTTTPTVLPSGTTVEITGPIENIRVVNNTTFVIVAQHNYLLSPDFVARLGSRLVVGVPIDFQARYDDQGQVVVINIVTINNQPFAANPPPKKDKGGKGKGNGGGDNGNGGGDEGGD